MKKSAAAYLLKLAPAAFMGISCARARKQASKSSRPMGSASHHSGAGGPVDKQVAAGTAAGTPLQQSRLAVTFSSRMVKGKVVATLSCAAMILPRLGETCVVSASPAAQHP